MPLASLGIWSGLTIINLGLRYKFANPVFILNDVLTSTSHFSGHSRQHAWSPFIYQTTGRTWLEASCWATACLKVCLDCFGLFAPWFLVCWRKRLCGARTYPGPPRTLRVNKQIFFGAVYYHPPARPGQHVCSHSVLWRRRSVPPPRSAPHGVHTHNEAHSGNIAVTIDDQLTVGVMFEQHSASRNASLTLFYFIVISRRVPPRPHLAASSQL